MSDKCPFCGAGIRENLHTLKTFTCNTKYSLFSEEWVYWQSVECKDRQIANLTASRNRWKELAGGRVGGVMMKCPKCGAEWRVEKGRYDCGSYPSLPVEFFQTGLCKDRQIANLTASLDEATRLLRYQEERNHSLNERLNEAEDRLERLLGEL